MSRIRQSLAAIAALVSAFFERLGNPLLGISLPVIAVITVSTFVAAFSAPDATAASDAIVLDWNQIAVEAVDGTPLFAGAPAYPATPPFPSTRAMASVQLAVFEAVNAITQRYAPYFGTVTALPGASEEAAAVAAAHDTLVWLFPVQKSSLDQEQSDSLAAITDVVARDRGVAAGQAAAAAVIADRANDNAQPLKFYTAASTAPYDWQPTPACTNAPASGRGTFFNWQSVKAFGIESSSQFRAAAPPPLVSGNYANDFNEVQAVGDASASSTLRPPDRTAVAIFYAKQPPHRGWNLAARQLARERGTDEITRTARTLAIMNMSLSDAHITVFESKYYYTTWRPETAIARADEDGNHRTTASGTFQPFVLTPCFPSYPSAHGAGGGAARTVLERAYGRKHHDITLTDASAPAIVLHYSDLRTITDDVADARVYGGIHFRFDQEAGERMGVDIGHYNDEHRLRPVNPNDDY